MSDGIPLGLMEKARTLTARTGWMKEGFDGALRLAGEAQHREALLRAELTVALHESMSDRARLAARLEQMALSTHAVTARPGRLRRHNRLSRLFDRLLARLGPAGQALVISRSGVWDGHAGRIAAYVRRRADPAAQPETHLDQAWYLATYPDVARGRTAPLVHYLLSGGREGRAPGPLFDPGYYARNHAGDLAAHGVTPLEHYMVVGAARGFSPHPLFDPAHYLAQVGPLPAGEEPLAHYLREGWRTGARPHALFDPAWYLRRVGDIGEEPPLLHYLRQGWRKGISPHPLFDSRWYLDSYPDVAEAGIDPLTHFLRQGGVEHRNPGPWFDTRAYVEMRGGALAPDCNPLLDYVSGGAWEIEEIAPGLATAAYLSTRPDSAGSGLTPLEHWARRGTP